MSIHNKEYIQSEKDNNIVMVQNNHDYKDVDFKRSIVLQSNDMNPIEYVVDWDRSKMSGLIKDILENKKKPSFQSQHEWKNIHLCHSIHEPSSQQQSGSHRKNIV